MQTNAMAEFAVLVSIGSFIIGTIVLIAFFIMAINIGTITKILRNIHAQQMRMASDLSATNIKARAYDAAEAAKN